MIGRFTLLTAIVCRCASGFGAPIETVTTLHDTIPVYGSQADVKLASFAADKNDETVVIAAGRSLALTGQQTALDVLVRGTLTIRPGASLTCRTLTVLGKNARLEMNGNCTLTIRDMPIDPKIDPNKYGHGLLVIDGTLVIATDDWRQSWQQLAKEIMAGDTVIELVGEARGWRAGDRLVLPDTRQPSAITGLSARTEVATIASTYGGKVTLTAPVRFNHLGWRDSSRNAQVLPEIGCLTQPVVIKSQNPKGTRGHVFITAGAHQDVQGAAVVEMGRTTTAPLGTSNQIGRYAWHHHHLLGRVNNGLPWQFQFEHCSVDSSPKWGIAVHGSHFGIVNDCFVYNCAGCGIVTEDPWVYGNRITNNMVVAKQRGSGQRITDRADRNAPSGDHWHDMGGLGLESAMNEITGNRLYCCKDSIGMAGFATQLLYKPAKPGVCPSCEPSNRIGFGEHAGYVPGVPKRYPFVLDTSNNRAWGGWRGIELWTADTYVEKEHGFDGLTLIHCRYPTDLEDQRETVMRGWRILGDWAQAAAPVDGGETATFALDFKPGYRFGITAIGCEFRGYGAAYKLIHDSEYTRFQQCTFECPVINYQPLGRYANLGGSWSGEWTDCVFLGNPLFAGGWYPKYDLSLWINRNKDPDKQSLKPIRYFVRPWHDGRDYQVYHYEQHSEWRHPSGPPPAGQAYGDWPAGVWTQAQLVERGTPIFGDVVPPGAVRWGKFYASEVARAVEATSCADEVERLRNENTRLQRALEQLQAQQ